MANTNDNNAATKPEHRGEEACVQRVARPRACDCAQNLTDADLPPIRRVWGNLWKEKWREGYMELVKANKGLRRLNYRCEKLRAEVRWLKNELEHASPKGPSEKLSD